MRRELISYPKSGRSWLRFVLSQLGVEDQISFHHDGFEFNDGTLPQHSFDIAARLRQYAAVDRLVYLDRDPRDVMVSLFFQVTGRFKDIFNYRHGISEFLRDEYFGAIVLRRFRDMWDDILAEKDHLRISYEECHEDQLKVISQVLTYCQISFDFDRLCQGVEAASFERMKSVELSGDFPHPWLRPRNGALKVREGRVGGFMTALNSADIGYLNEVFGLS